MDLSASCNPTTCSTLWWVHVDLYQSPPPISLHFAVSTRVIFCEKDMIGLRVKIDVHDDW